MIPEVLILDSICDEDRMLDTLEPAPGVKNTWIENDTVSGFRRNPLSVPLQQIHSDQP